MPAGGCGQLDACTSQALNEDGVLVLADPDRTDGRQVVDQFVRRLTGPLAPRKPVLPLPRLVPIRS
jgi:hypothetical protein